MGSLLVSLTLILALTRISFSSEEDDLMKKSVKEEEQNFDKFSNLRHGETIAGDEIQEDSKRKGKQFWPFFHPR